MLGFWGLSDEQRKFENLRVVEGRALETNLLRAPAKPQAVADGSSAPEDLASHDDHESCAFFRKRGGEALTGESTAEH